MRIFKITHTLHNGFSLGSRPFRKSGAVEELRGHLIVGHRIRRISLGHIRTPGNQATVFQVYLDDRRHLVVSGSLGNRIHAEVDPADHLLNLRTVHNLIREFCESGLPIEQKHGHAEFHAELSGKAIRWVVVDKSGGKVSIGADSNPFYLVRCDVVLLNQRKHLRHAGMGKGSRGEWLNGNTRRNERPGLTKLIHDGRGVETSTLRLEKSTRRFQYLVR